MRFHSLTIASALAATVLVCTGAAHAGLAEKRAIAAYQKDVYPAQEAEIRKVVGAELPIEVAWDDLAIDERANLYNEGFTKVYFQPLITALNSIAADDLGKEALLGALKSIKIQNKKNTAYFNEGITFADGVLTIDLSPIANMDRVDDRTKHLTKVLENAL